MAARFARIDVDFMSKNTAQTLLDELGPWGPLLFLALILKAKDGVEPGVFTYTTDAIGWDRLGILDPPEDITLDQFFTVTGRLKQTRRTCVGRVKNVTLTRYADWQKDSKRYEEAVKKRRSRARLAGDTTVTQQGTPEGREGGPISTSITNPLPPKRRRNGSRPTGPSQRPTIHACPRCDQTFDTLDAYETHRDWSTCAQQQTEEVAA